jgi:hypothetical protein
MSVRCGSGVEQAASGCEREVCYGCCDCGQPRCAQEVLLLKQELRWESAAQRSPRAPNHVRAQHHNRGCTSAQARPSLHSIVSCCACLPDPLVLSQSSLPPLSPAPHPHPHQHPHPKQKDLPYIINLNPQISHIKYHVLEYLEAVIRTSPSLHLRQTALQSLKVGSSITSNNHL